MSEAGPTPGVPETLVDQLRSTRLDILRKGSVEPPVDALYLLARDARTLDTRAEVAFDLVSRGMPSNLTRRLGALRLRTKADDALLDVRADIDDTESPTGNTDLSQLVLDAVMRRAAGTERTRVRFETDDPSVRRALLDADFGFEDAEEFVHAVASQARLITTEALARTSAEINDTERAYALAALAAALNASLALEGDVSRPFEVSGNSTVAIAAIHQARESDIWHRLAERAPTSWRTLTGRSTQGNTLPFGEVALEVIRWVALLIPDHPVRRDEPSVLEAFSGVANTSAGGERLPQVAMPSGEVGANSRLTEPTSDLLPLLDALRAELPELAAYVSHDSLRREPVLTIHMPAGQTVALVVPHGNVQPHRVVGMARALRDLIVRFPGSAPAELDCSGAEQGLRPMSTVDAWYFAATRSIKLNAAFVTTGFAHRDDLVYSAQQHGVYDRTIPSPATAVLATAWAYGYLDALAREHPRVLAALLTDPAIDLFDGKATLTTPFMIAGAVSEESRRSALRALSMQLGLAATQSRGAALAALVARAAVSPASGPVGERVRALLAGGLRNNTEADPRISGVATPKRMTNSRFSNTQPPRRG